MTINKALLKHGYSNFQLEILEYCEPADAIEREQYYINLLNPSYNILKIAGSSFGYKHTEESKVLMREKSTGRKGRKLSEQTKALMKDKATGRKHSEETISKIVASVSASMLGHEHSEETRRKIGETMGTAVKVTDSETGITNIYYSKRQAAKELNTSLATVRNYIISGKPYMGRFLIEINSKL